MKTIEETLNNYEFKSFDGRDLVRLADFMTVEQLAQKEITFKDPSKLDAHVPLSMTREAVLERLKVDLEFAFNKALDKRGLSATCMFYVIMMWNWILQEGLEDFSEDTYAQYGLPLLKATAVKYGFTNPIGDDIGNENWYSDEEDYIDNQYMDDLIEYSEGK